MNNSIHSPQTPYPHDCMHLRDAQKWLGLALYHFHAFSFSPSWAYPTISVVHKITSRATSLSKTCSASQREHDFTYISIIVLPIMSLGSIPAFIAWGMYLFSLCYCTNDPTTNLQSTHYNRWICTPPILEPSPQNKKYAPCYALVWYILPSMSLGKPRLAPLEC